MCSKYFKNYDNILTQMQGKVNSVNATFDDWTKHVMKPQQLSEARMFALETWVSEEEDFWIKECN